MDISVPAADANRKFSELLRGVQQGKTYTVTSHGRPVAKISPVETIAPQNAEAERRAAFRQFIAELRDRPALNLPKITRDEMHERD